MRPRRGLGWLGLVVLLLMGWLAHGHRITPPGPDIVGVSAGPVESLSDLGVIPVPKSADGGQRASMSGPEETKLPGVDRESLVVRSTAGLPIERLTFRERGKPDWIRVFTNLRSEVHLDVPGTPIEIRSSGHRLTQVDAGCTHVALEPVAHLILLWSGPTDIRCDRMRVNPPWKFRETVGSEPGGPGSLVWGILEGGLQVALSPEMEGPWRDTPTEISLDLSSECWIEVEWVAKKGDRIEERLPRECLTPVPLVDVAVRLEPPPDPSEVLFWDLLSVPTRVDLGGHTQTRRWSQRWERPWGSLVAQRGRGEPRWREFRGGSFTISDVPTPWIHALVVMEQSGESYGRRVFWPTDEEEIVVHLSAARRVIGRLVDPEGAPLETTLEFRFEFLSDAGLPDLATSAWASPRQPIRTTSHGVFEVELGRPSFQASHPWPRPDEAKLGLTVLPNGPTLQFPLAWGQGATIDLGRVQVDRPQPDLQLQRSKGVVPRQELYLLWTGSGREHELVTRVESLGGDRLGVWFDRRGDRDDARALTATLGGEATVSNFVLTDYVDVRWDCEFLGARLWRVAEDLR